MIGRLHELIDEAGVDFLISGAPQCVIGNSDMDELIFSAKVRENEFRDTTARMLTS
jgi:hypothetical protein